MALPHIHVTCAIIERDGLVLAARRSAVMSMPLKWEFPGGKINPGETLQECLCRELLEETGVCVIILEALSSHTHHYQDFTVTLYPFVSPSTAGRSFCTNMPPSPGYRRSAFRNWDGPGRTCR